ncbi:MAG: hypothetical protein CML84_01735 [Rhodobiaceae bacterium]|nr:hypothetical protein [Rhodobiaceae bacterium]|tara:strand:- start:173 stop:580 length:408 start_codon:yes stop_codon:yes gene_type:complete
MIINIEVNQKQVATLIKNIRTEERINFFTKNEDQLQIAAFNMKKNEKIQPHMHLQNERRLDTTAEVLYVQEGILIVNFYSNPDYEIIDKSYKLEAGDLILLSGGIHGFEIGENCRFLEIKQGPFKPTGDKLKLYD